MWLFGVVCVCVWVLVVWLVVGLYRMYVCMSVGVVFVCVCVFVCLFVCVCLCRCSCMCVASCVCVLERGCMFVCCVCSV